MGATCGSMHVCGLLLNAGHIDESRRMKPSQASRVHQRQSQVQQEYCVGKTAITNHKSPKVPPIEYAPPWNSPSDGQEP